jgi:hypothetical protein
MRTGGRYCGLLESIIADKFSNMLGLPSSLQIPPREANSVWIQNRLIALQEPDGSWNRVDCCVLSSHEANGLRITDSQIFISGKIYPASFEKNKGKNLSMRTSETVMCFWPGLDSSQIVIFDCLVGDRLHVANFREKKCPLRMKFIDCYEEGPQESVVVVDEESKEEINIPPTRAKTDYFVKIFNHEVEPIEVIEDSREVVGAYPIVDSKYEVVLFSQTYPTYRTRCYRPEMDVRFVYDRETHEFFVKKKEETGFVLEQEYAVLEICKIPRKQLAQILQEHLVDDLVGLLLEFMMHTTSEEFLTDPEQFEPQLRGVAEKFDSTSEILREKLIKFFS